MLRLFVLAFLFVAGLLLAGCESAFFPLPNIAGLCAFGVFYYLTT